MVAGVGGVADGEARQRQRPGRHQPRRALARVMFGIKTDLILTTATNPQAYIETSGQNSAG